MSRVWNIIVAAGSGSRFGSDLPKQFHLLKGKPVLFHTIEQFRNALPNSTTLLVIDKSMVEYWVGLCKDYDFDSPVIVFGGSTRWESVRNALNIIPDSLCNYALIHDGARPIVTTDVINNVLDALNSGSVGAIPFTPITDSIRRVWNDGNSVAVDRNNYVAVQTPQGFRFKDLKIAYEMPFDKKFTDDASVITSAGTNNLTLVKGDVNNIKITNPMDLQIAELLLK